MTRVTRRWHRGTQTRPADHVAYMAEPIHETVHTVARDGKAISSSVVGQAEADNELHRIESNVRAAMLEPDVTFATATRTTPRDRQRRADDMGQLPVQHKRRHPG